MSGKRARRFCREASIASRFKTCLGAGSLRAIDRHSPRPELPRPRRYRVAEGSPSSRRMTARSTAPADKLAHCRSSLGLVVLPIKQEPAEGDNRVCVGSCWIDNRLVQFRRRFCRCIGESGASGGLVRGDKLAGAVLQESHREAEPLGEAELDIADRSLADLDPRRHTLVATRQHRRGWPFDQLSNTETLLAPSPADRRQMTGQSECRAAAVASGNNDDVPVREIDPRVCLPDPRVIPISDLT